MRGFLPAAGSGLGLVLLCCTAAEGYVGPGAGFAFFSAFLLVLVSSVLALFALLSWPLRWTVRALVRGRRRRQGRVKRVVVVGLDGLDPELLERFMGEGVLPHFSGLRDQGCFRRLGTTLPAESPVAWSSFMTGCNPGKHRIYDFLAPNRRTLRPELAAGHVESSPRALRLGRYRIPLGRPVFTGGRRSKTFWQVLSEHGVFSSVLRVPLSFPPEPFDGVLLAGMCAPDLRGSQGTYFYFTSNAGERRELKSGLRLGLELREGLACGRIPGPANPLAPGSGEMEVEFAVQLRDAAGGAAELEMGRERYLLKVGEYTPWVRVVFRPGLGFQVRGLCRFLLLEIEPHIRLYVTPLQIDPARPAMPISHPLTYSVYLAKTRGPFATLGIAEDTSALNEGIIGAAAFMEQCRSIHAEREAMFFDALEKTPQGAVVCVFDMADRVQHMFWGQADADSAEKAEQGKSLPGPLSLADTLRDVGSVGEVDQGKGEYRHLLRDLYREMDGLVGRIRERLGREDALLVMSDHGFKSFRRQVDLNAWLKESGYLAVREEAAGEDMLGAIDWERTRAYAVGFGGIYLNLAGREARGIVVPGKEAELVKREIAAALGELRDGDGGEKAVSRVYDRDRAYSGPYVDEAPDLVVGFRPGYRVAWRTVTGGVGDEVLADNLRPWSGDHSFDPEAVPGVLLCDCALSGDAPRIVDIGPTVLDLLGVPVPAYMDGRSLVGEETPDEKG